MRGEKRRVSVHSSLIVVRLQKEENWNRCLVSRAISRNDLPPAFPPPQEDGRRTVALSFLFPFLSSSRPFSLSHTKISTYEIFDAEQRAPSRTVWFTAIFYLCISAFTVATQHGEPINFASAPIKTDTASLPREKSGTQFRRTGENVVGKNFFSKTGRIMLSKLYSLFSSFLSLFYHPFLSLRFFLLVPFRFGEKLDVVEKLDRQTRPPKVISRDSFCQRACTTSAIRARACWRETPWRWVRSKNTTALWHGAPRPVSLAVVYIDEEAVASAINAPLSSFLPSTLFHQRSLHKLIDRSFSPFPFLRLCLAIPSPIFFFFETSHDSELISRHASRQSIVACLTILKRGSSRRPGNFIRTIYRKFNFIGWPRK